jgi:hypothetical protein
MAPNKSISVRLDEIHLEFLEKMVEKLTAEEVKTNRTDVIQKALYSFARDSVLGAEVVSEIIDRLYREFEQ